jgi:hypothetical protein
MKYSTLGMKEKFYEAFEKFLSERGIPSKPENAGLACINEELRLSFLAGMELGIKVALDTAGKAKNLLEV